MSHCWLLLVSLFGSARLQYLSPGGQTPVSALDPMPPASYLHYYHLRPTPEIEGYSLPNSEDHIQFYDRGEEEQADVQRTRRTLDELGKSWEPNLLDKDKTAYYSVEDKTAPNSEETKSTTPPENFIDNLEKRNFSPWGGKRDKPSPIEHNWTWKRSTSVREPNMPKRVRFSPWGGKRSGQILYKTGMKGSKIIFSTSMPELTRVVSNYSPSGERYIAGLQIVPTFSKRHPIEILAMSSKMEGSVRDPLPFKSFLMNLPKMFKPGHTYADVNLKKDGKRKLKFSAWGGKRSPPIIGPIWSPQDLTVSGLDAFLLVKKAQDIDQMDAQKPSS